MLLNAFPVWKKQELLHNGFKWKNIWSRIFIFTHLGHTWDIHNNDRDEWSYYIHIIQIKRPNYFLILLFSAALIRPELNFGGYRTFESNSKALKPDDFAIYLCVPNIAISNRSVTRLFCLHLASKIRKILVTVFEFMYVVTPFCFSLKTKKIF